MKIMLARFGALINSSGGIERVICGMANALIESGHDVTIICCEEKQGYPYFKLKSRVKFYNLNINGEKIRSRVDLRIKREILKFFGALTKTQKDKIFIESRYDNIIKMNFFKLIASEKFDVVITFDSLSLLFLKYLIKIKYPVIAMLHNDVNTYFNETMSEILLASFRDVNAIQVLNNKWIKVVKQYCPNVRCVFIPNAIFDYDKLKNIDIGRNNKLILQVGSLTRDIKRPHITIKAFDMIFDEARDWTLEIVGGTHSESQELYKEELVQFIKENNLSKTISFVGETRNIIENFAKASIFAFPSSSEGMPLALIEAMAAGLPAIGYKSCPAVNEIIIDGYNGFLCNDGIEDFANKMKILIQNEELREKMGKNARKSVNKFIPEKIWNQWEDLIEEVVKIKD